NTVRDAMKTLQDEVTGSLEVASTELEVHEALQRANADAMNLGSTALDEFGDSAGAAKDRLGELNTAIQNAFGEQNVLAGFADDFYNLMEGVAEGGAGAFSFMAEDGKANLDNLQASIASTIFAAESMGADSAQAVAGLFLELKRQGIDVASLLASLGNTSFGGGVTASAVGEYVNGSKAMDRQSSTLSTTMQELAKRANQAAAAKRNRSEEHT